MRLTLLAGLLGCPDPKGPGPDPATSDPTLTADTSTTPGATDTSAPPTTPAPAFVLGPELIAADPARALAFRLRADTDLPATLRVVVEGPDGVLEHRIGPASTSHDAALAQWTPGARHMVGVRAVSAGGVEGPEVALEVVAPAAPANLPVIEVRAADPTRVEPGVTVLTASSGGTGDPSYVLAVDGDGGVVWWLADPHQVLGLQRLSSGNVGFVGDKDGLYEVELDGTPVAEWHPEGRGTGGVQLSGVNALFHDFLELPDGRFAALSLEVRRVEGYPTSETDAGAPRAAADVVGPVVVVFERSGVVGARWPLLDLLDPTRIGYDGVRGGYWDEYLAGEVADPKDWGHGNGLAHDPATDRILVSLRNQDAVVALDLTTGAPAWVLAPPANWDPGWSGPLLTADGPLPWSYHLHNPNPTPEGTVLLFDNGNKRASAYEPWTPDDENASRAVELAVDPGSMTVRQVWSYGIDRPDRLFCASHGSAQPMPTTGNVLVTFGNVSSSDDPDPPDAVVVEVTREEPAEVVLELAVRSPGGGAWSVFRGVRVASLARAWP